MNRDNMFDMFDVSDDIEEIDDYDYDDYSTTYNKTDLEILKDNYKILLDYVKTLEERNDNMKLMIEKLKKEIMILKNKEELEKYEKQI